MWLSLKLICSHFNNFFECWIASRTPSTSQNWYKWHKSWRRRVEMTWPIFYELISFSDKQKRQKKAKLCLTTPSYPIKLWQPAPTYLTPKKSRPCCVKVFKFKDWTFQNHMYINLQMIIEMQKLVGYFLCIPKNIIPVFHFKT